MSSTSIARSREVLRDRWSIHGRSADTNLVEIHEEMSELLDKQVNVQKESLKNFQGSRKLPQAHEKVCDENKERKKKATAA